MSARDDLEADLAPEALVPGDLDAIIEAAEQATAVADRLAEIGKGLGYLDLAWSGRAADAFRDFFTSQPRRFNDACTTFAEVGSGLREYADAMVVARHEAERARVMYREGRAAEAAAAAAAATSPPGVLTSPAAAPAYGSGTDAAVVVLETARADLAGVAGSVSSVIRSASAVAPSSPTLGLGEVVEETPVVEKQPGDVGSLPAMGLLVGGLLGAVPGAIRPIARSRRAAQAADDGLELSAGELGVGGGAAMYGMGAVAARGMPLGGGGRGTTGAVHRGIGAPVLREGSASGATGLRGLPLNRVDGEAPGVLGAKNAPRTASFVETELGRRGSERRNDLKGVDAPDRAEQDRETHS